MMRKEIIEPALAALLILSFIAFASYHFVCAASYQRELMSQCLEDGHEEYECYGFLARGGGSD